MKAHATDFGTIARQISARYDYIDQANERRLRSTSTTFGPCYRRVTLEGTSEVRCRRSCCNLHDLELPPGIDGPRSLFSVFFLDVHRLSLRLGCLLCAQYNLARSLVVVLGASGELSERVERPERRRGRASGARAIEIGRADATRHVSVLGAALGLSFAINLVGLFPSSSFSLHFPFPLLPTFRPSLLGGHGTSLPSRALGEGKAPDLYTPQPGPLPTTSRPTPHAPRCLPNQAHLSSATVLSNRHPPLAVPSTSPLQPGHILIVP